jgi:gamma-glutamylcyclotransferase (GGCT)/AIG2-like uncharacterized protein YtfP
MSNCITSLFVYGTLRRDCNHSAYVYISDHFSFHGYGKVKGLLYDLEEYPAAVASSENLFVAGELYELNRISDFESTFRILDAYEIADVDTVEQLFKRELTEVITNGEIKTAWIYWYNRPITDETLIQSGDILSLTNQKNKY